MRASIFPAQILVCLLALSVTDFSERCLGQEVPGEKTEEKEDPSAWSIRSYRISNSDFIFSNLGYKKFELPETPSEKAESAAIQRFIKGSSTVLNKFFADEGIPLPAGSLAVFDDQNDTLVIRTTGKLHRRIDLLIQNLRRPIPHMLAFQLDVFEIETGEILKAMNEAAGKTDHGAILAQLERQIEKGKGRMLISNRLDTRTGQRAKITNLTNFGFAAEFEIGAKNTTRTNSRSVRDVGTVFEFDPVLGADHSMIDLNYVLQHHLAPPTLRQVPVATLGGKRVEMPVTDFYTASISSAVSLHRGQSKLIGVWEAKAEPAGERQVVAFITADAFPVVRADDRIAVGWLKKEGEKVIPTPKEKPEEVGEIKGDPNMPVARFPVPPDFLSYGQEGDSADGPIDPFAPVPHPKEPKVTARELLESQGIPFPEGSDAQFNPATSELIVRNLPKHLSLVESFVDWHPRYSPQIQILLHIIQADGPTLRKLNRATMGQADHTGMWKELEKMMEAGDATLVRTGWIETRSGQRARSTAVIEYAYANGNEIVGKKLTKPKGEGTPATPTISHSGGSIVPAFDVEDVGLDWEIDPMVGTYGETITLNIGLNVDSSSPAERFEKPVQKIGVFPVDSPEVDFHENTISTALVTRSGMKRLLGIWKPKGASDLERKDVLQAAFIEAHIVYVVSKSHRSGIDF